MPQAAAAAVVSWVGVTGATATIVSAVVYVAVTAAINYGLTRISMALAGKPKRERSPAGRDVTVRGTVQSMQMIYGEVRAPGFVVFFGTSGDDNRYLHFVIAYAAHQCEEISDVWLDGRRVANADIAGDGSVTATEFDDDGSKLYVYKHLGTNAQAADSVLLPLFSWTSNHRGAGVAYAHFRLDYSEKVWASGAPGNYFALVKGRRLYDPRLDSTNGGSGSHRYNDATTWAWSHNWALCVRDYITGGSRWYDVATPEPRLGFGENNARIDDVFTIAAANISDEDVLIPPASPTTTQDRYTCDVQLSCGETHRENLEILKSAAAGNITYVNGQYRIYAGAYDTPTVTINEDDILGPMTVVTHPSGDELYNFVTGTFFDEARDWQLSPFPNITNSSYETADGGQFKRSIELFATRSSYRAQRIAILILAQSRNKIAVRFERLSPKAMAISQHETFFVTCSEYGWSNKVFRCLDWEWMPDGFIALTAREESSATYADPSVGTYAAANEATVDTPEYDEPVAPTNLTARAMPNGIAFRWDAGAPLKTDQVYHLYEHTAQTPFSSATRVWSGQSLAVLLDRADYTTRYYWVTASLNGQESSATPAGNGLAASWKGEDTVAWAVDALGKPAGIRAIDSIADRSQLQFGGIGIQILGSPDANVGYGFPAIPIDSTSLYQLTIRHRSSAADSDGLYLRFFELNAALPAGNTHIGNPPAESVVATHWAFVDLVTNGPMPGTTTIESVYTYNPTPGTRFASFSMYNWTGFTGTYEIEWVRLTRVGSNVNLLAQGAYDTGDLIPNSATLVESVEDDSVSLSSGGGVVLSDSLSAIGVDHLLQITASFDVWITNTGGGTPEFYLAAINSGGTLQQSQSVFPTASASPGQRITLQVEVPITVADEASTIFSQLVWTGAQPTGTAEVRNAAMRSEHIKR